MNPKARWRGRSSGVPIGWTCGNCHKFHIWLSDAKACCGSSRQKWWRRIDWAWVIWGILSLLAWALVFYVLDGRADPIITPIQLPGDSILSGVSDTSPVCTPEPSSMALAGAGMVVIGLRFLVKGWK